MTRRSETKTLYGKVRFVLDRNGSLEGRALVLEVWRQFYWNIVSNPEGEHPTVSLYDAFDLPSAEKIISAGKKYRSSFRIAKNCSVNALAERRRMPWYAGTL